MKNNSTFQFTYIILLIILLGYYGYCGLTGRYLMEFGASSQWSPASNPGPHHK
jgi:hypothetical protein